jgi:hypothetical protein
MLLLVRRSLSLIFFLSTSAAAWADQPASLAWLPSPTADIAGYAVYYGSSSGVYDFRFDVGSQTNATISGLADGTTFFFAVSAYNQLGVESELSNEISFLTADAWLHFGPGLAPIVDRTIHVGSLLMISNSVVGLNLPATAWRFSLSQAAACIATINSTNGLFTWQTSPSDSGTTNRFTIQVSDVLRTNLADTQSFTVSVVQLPSIVSLNISNNLPSIAWTSIPGQSYRLQFQDVLGADWLDLAPPVQAFSEIASVTDPAAASDARFYRILVCPPP